MKEKDRWRGGGREKIVAEINERASAKRKKRRKERMNKRGQMLK